MIEPVTWIQSASGKEVLVYYSLGNFINATSGTGQGTAARMVGAMAQVTIEMDEQNRPYISSYGVEPLVTHNVSGTGQITTYRLKDYTEELAVQNEMRKQDPFILTFLLPVYMQRGVRRPVSAVIIQKLRGTRHGRIKGTEFTGF